MLREFVLHGQPGCSRSQDMRPWSGEGEAWTW